MSTPDRNIKELPAAQQAPIERRLAFLTFVSSFLPSLLLVLVLWYFEVSLYAAGIVAVLLLFLIAYSVSTVWRQSQYQFRSINNLLDAIVRGDYSFRGANTAGNGAFGELVASINALARTLQRQRMQSEESQLLVQKVVDQIDVAIIAWDQNQHIHLINPAARELLFLPDKDSNVQILPAALSFANSINVGETVVRDLQFPTSRGRYRLHLERFITDGDTHNLLFLTNVSAILRLEERKAWRNLVRVLSHEINNSLTPLKSYSSSLKTQIQKRETDPVLKQELLDGVTVIGNRADSLANFVQSYHRISRIPEPEKKPVNFLMLATEITKLFSDHPVQIMGEAVELLIDPAQIEQVIINLLKNAVEASTAASPVLLGWQQQDTQLVIKVIDNGEGILSPENLFTPYYTTKPSGSGIGLVFCQQVIEAHGGFMNIANRGDSTGCEVSVSLPLQ